MSRRTLLADALFGDPRESPRESNAVGTSEEPLEPCKDELMEGIRIHRASLRFEQAPSLDEPFEATARVLDVAPFVVSIPSVAHFLHGTRAPVAWTLFDAPIVVSEEGCPLRTRAEVGDVILLRARIQQSHRGARAWRVRASTMRIVSRGASFSTHCLI